MPTIFPPVGVHTIHNRDINVNGRGRVLSGNLVSHPCVSLGSMKGSTRNLRPGLRLPRRAIDSLRESRNYGSSVQFATQRSRGWSPCLSGWHETILESDSYEAAFLRKTLLTEARHTNVLSLTGPPLKVAAKVN